MPTITDKQIFDGIRERREARGFTLPQHHVDTINTIMYPEANIVERPAPPQQPTTATGEPAWITIGKRYIGQREIPGVQHNPWIVRIWARIKAPWFRDDETPWCAGFVAWCLSEAGLPILPPAVVARALAWKNYGVQAHKPQVGAIGVKSRSGGGHVFFIIGETPDKRFFKVLEGNANNMVRIGDIAKSEVIAMRWPANVPTTNAPLPVMPPGTISRSEA